MSRAIQMRTVAIKYIVVVPHSEMQDVDIERTEMLTELVQSMSKKH